MPMGFLGIPGLGLATRTLSTGGVYQFVNTEAAAYVAAMDVKPNDRWKELYDTLIGELKTADIFDNLDVAYIPAAHDEQAGRLNIKSPDNFTCVDVSVGPAFEAGEGITGTGSTGWNTTWSPSAHGVNFTQDDASICVWCNSSQAAANVRELGSNSGAARANIMAFGSGDLLRGSLNDATISSFGSSISSALGMSLISRTDSSTLRAFKNKDAKGTTSVASTGLASLVQYICMPNPSGGGTKEIGFASWGASMQGKEEDFHTALDNFMNGVTWISGDFILLNGDSFTNSIFVTELEAATGLPVFNVGVGGTDPFEQLAVFEALPPIMKKYGILVDMDGGINPESVSAVVAAKQAQIDALASPARYVIIEPSPGNNYAGTSYRTSEYGYDAQVAAMAAAFGDNFIECRAALQALNDGSPEDLADVAGDIVPRSLRSDDIHELQPASAKRCELTATFMQSQGWIA